MAAPDLFGPLCVRTEAGAGIGIGHLVRCLALAQAWEDRGGQPCFLASQSTLDLLEGLAPGRFASRALTSTPASAADARETAALIRSLGAGWLVLDGYAFRADYRQSVRATGHHLLVVDDLADSALDGTDLILNQNPQATAAAYGYRAAGARLLLGCRFALLRREYLTWREARHPIPEQARQVLVMLGGADPANLTGRVLALLADFRDWPLELTVVIGPANPHRAAIDAGLAGHRGRHRTELLVNPPDLPARLTQADVAISAAGTSCWELACLGVPMALIIAADNQAASAAWLEQAGLAVILGSVADFPSAQTLSRLRDLCADAGARQRQAARGRELVDGRGAGRVAETLATWPVVLRPATAADAESLHQWANDPLTRRMSFNTANIPWESHLAWLGTRLGDPDCRLRLGAVDGRPVGQVRLDRAGPVATLSVSVAPEARGRGLGARLVRAAAVDALDDGWCREIEALVRPDNDASLRLFPRAGFADRGLVPGHPQGARRFVLAAPAQ